MTSVPRVVLASRNQHKVGEIRRILKEAGAVVDLVSVAEFSGVPDVVETGLTFTENALLKAREVAAATGLPALAEDSGISTDALNGMPGVFSARWSGRHGDDVANLELLLAQLRDVPDYRRGAAFVCVAALVVPAGTTPGLVTPATPEAVAGPAEVVEEGRVDGHLIREPRGSGGFGYDPIFVPEGHDRTTAEMSAEEKDALSHRGRAMRAMAAHLS
ncbi:RdgB/HAM1 family non-canonical purine NTP pyrophosphatase [Phytoactinopolyspora halotolerans]|uniref:dITP/XTP pyrophosphatase n=1 Tax=Phytoactinopolyspora halotolerans TaxID=1981512 RepID=A0A6L9SAP8_9ACTN|nr:RdgB/HAM1 family non-canonical purine NTP pyrophosphatase [Phytoactinopolyspora halotolerans]NEE01578.1 RdgB/HAM1 family non-canonical purine NTP pyrophosphatase [Phytoactinopolyspora halotolerans]